MTIGRIQHVPLREVWRHEAYDFTRWLQENLDALDEVLDLGLTNAEREQDAGSFSVDLVAEDSNGNAVVIENQLEKSDHDHLGKLITYLVALEAKVAIWIVAQPRPEHVGAVTWLNESRAADFYLVKLEGVRIGDSPPAPLLTLIAGPSEEGREIGEVKQGRAERHDLRKRFWTELLELAKTRTKLHAGAKANESNYVITGSGKSGLTLGYTVRQHEIATELYIDRGKDAEVETKAIFDGLHDSKAAIEAAFGEELLWERLDGKRACRISKRLVGGYRDPEADWPRIQTAAIDAMIRLERALRPHISKID